MNRPSFQFYPADWRGNAKLRRCSDAARGVWIDLLCVLHDSDEYGVCRWPLEDLARAASAPLPLVMELVTKDVLKGSDDQPVKFEHTTRHSGQDGDTFTLVKSDSGPCWYSSRLVRDEWLRGRRGMGSRFDSENQPNRLPKPSPTRRTGGRQGDGPSSSSSSSIKTLGAKAPRIIDESFLESLKKEPAYSGINIEVELGKMKTWCFANRKSPSPRRFVNWLNRAEPSVSPFPNSNGSAKDEFRNRDIMDSV